MNNFKFNAKLLIPVLILALLLSGCGASYKAASAPEAEEAGYGNAKYEMATDQTAFSYGSSTEDTATEELTAPAGAPRGSQVFPKIPK